MDRNCHAAARRVEGPDLDVDSMACPVRSVRALPSMRTARAYIKSILTFFHLGLAAAV